MYFRVTTDAPPLGRVTKWFTTEQTDECQAYIGKLQLKGFKVDCQRVSQEEYRAMLKRNEQE